MATQEMSIKRIAIYCRVSTDEQAKEGFSLDEQRTRLMAYCRAMGWTVEITDYVDDGYSAKNLERPALQRLLRDIKDGSVSKLMVTKLDRLSRRLLDLLTLIELFHHHNVTFVSTSESFDTDTPSGRLTLQVLGAVAEFERERIRERVFENMLHAAKSGKWLTQHPYGYRLQDKELVIYEPEAEVVRRVFKCFLEDGLGFFAIAKRLNEEGIPSRHNKQWSIRSVKLMLTNPAYIGTLVWNRMDSSKKQRQVKDEEDWVVIPNSHPSIVDAEAWNRVQKRIESKPTTPPRAKTSPHLLGGFLRCGRCGASMAIGWSGWPKRHRIYRCSGYSNKGTCQSKPYRADEVEGWFKEGLQQLLSSIDTTIHQVIIPQMKTEQHSKIAQRIENAKKRYQRQVEAYTAGLIELETLTNEKENMERTIDEVNRQQGDDKISTDFIQLERLLTNKVKDVADAIEYLPIETAKAKLRTIVEAVVIHGIEEIEIKLRI